MTAAPSNPPPSVYPRRTKAAVALVLLLAGFGARTMLRRPLFGGPEVDAFDRRFLPLRAALTRGVVGYLSDTDSVAEFFLTQYAVVPVIVVRRATGFSTPGSGSNLVIGNFNSPATMAEALAKSPLKVKQDFDDGVLLLEPEAR